MVPQSAVLWTSAATHREPPRAQRVTDRVELQPFGVNYEGSSRLERRADEIDANSLDRTWHGSCIDEGVRGDGPAMMTNAATAARPPHAATVTVTQKVVIVNGNPEMLDILETVLDAGHYDVVFVESSEHAYSQIKRVQPNLAIICVDLDEADGFQVLSMLKLDEETRGIPVLTFTSEHGRDDLEAEMADTSDEELFPTAKAAVWMN
jgi:CheY-like chemotaxis protein